MKGRKPIPTELKILRGKPGHRSLNAHEAEPEQTEASLEVPANLNEAARLEWEEKAPMLQRLGLYTEADRDALALYCQTFAQWKEAQKKLNQYGMVVMSKETGGFPIISPWVRIAEKAQHQATKLLIEFGLTPSSRSRVTAAKPKTSQTHQDKFFGRSRTGS